eukprot:CAMPEP_0171339514 /NCGR_PEP_ID=MMETSP0878-20121228/7993_1 /TAXON_ID=67004 /ORGANISM="Thalassiosira weissflogii, Strain CCMP1336" /LENGTH=739 /DNA_ID=CAMNT_0011841441 /DNA_START=115 /DNA_END=2334 /DNA_ORIENTATION=-
MEQQSMLGIMAAAAERLSSMQSEAPPSPNNSSPLPPDATSTKNSSAANATATATASSTNASASTSFQRPKLVLPELTSDLQEDLESTSGKNAHHGNIASLTTSTSTSMKIPLSIAKRPQWADYPLKDIVGPPHPHDVLCGRGGGSNNHPGNESFRELVNEVKVPYVNCPKREKPLIARRIVEAVRNQSPPGRFLQKDMDTGLWNDIGDAKAREKTSQALREGAPIIRDLLHAPSSGSDVANALKEAKRAGGGAAAAVGSAAALPGQEANQPSSKGTAAQSSPSVKGKHANLKAQDKQTSFPPAADTGNAALSYPANGNPNSLSHSHAPPHHGQRGSLSGLPNHYLPQTAGQPPIPPLPHVRLISNDEQRRGSLPPTKRFHSNGEVDLPSSSAMKEASLSSSAMPSRWSMHHPSSEQGRHLYRNDILPPSYHTHSHLPPPRSLHGGGGPQGMSLRGIGGGGGGLAPPYGNNIHRRASDYGMYPPHSHSHSLPPPRYVDSVPFETVRKLLLGQLDPVQLAMQILSPEDAALVARIRGGGFTSMTSNEGSRGRNSPSGMMYAPPPSSSNGMPSIPSSSSETSSSLPADTAANRGRTAPEMALSHRHLATAAAVVADAAQISDDSTSTGSSGVGGHSKQHSSSSLGSSHGGSDAGRDDGSAHSSNGESRGERLPGRSDECAASSPSYNWSNSNGSHDSTSSGGDCHGGSPGNDDGGSGNGCGRSGKSKKAHAVLPKKKRKFSA